MDLNLYTLLPAVEVRAGDHVLGIGGAVLQVDEVRHVLTAGDEGDVAITLLCWPAAGDRPARRTTIEYDHANVQAAVLPAGRVARAVWHALRQAVEAAAKAFIDAETDDVPGSGPVPQPPWSVEADTVVLRAAGRTWRLSPHGIPNDALADGGGEAG